MSFAFHLTEEATLSKIQILVIVTLRLVSDVCLLPALFPSVYLICLFFCHLFRLPLGVTALLFVLYL